MQSYYFWHRQRLLNNICIFVFFLSLTPTAISKNIDNTKQQWNRYKSDDGISGYEREIKDSKYIETRSEAVIDAPIEILLEVIDDIASYPRWMYKCKAAIELRKNMGNSRLLYIVQGSPLGSPDRDVIISANTITNWAMGSYTISFHSIDHDLSQYTDIKRDDDRQKMTEFRGKWEFYLIDRKSTKVVYTVFTDPGGFAPGFVVNGMMRKVSFNSVKDLMSMAKEKQYIDAARLSEAKKMIESNWKSKRQY